MKSQKVLAVALTVAIGTSALSPLASANQDYKTTSTADTQVYSQTYEQQQEYKDQGVVSWTYKTFKYALRAGGWLLSQAVKPFSKKSADWIRNNSKKIADIMDEGEKWTESMFSSAFKKIGADDDVADDLAKFLISII